MSVAKHKTLTFDRELKEGRDYWLERLGRGFEPSGLRPDFERPAVFSPEQDTLEVNFPPSLCEKLTKLTNDSPFLAYTTLLAALKVCLHRYAGAKTVSVGCPPRLRDGAEPPTPNALCVLDEIDPRQSFRQLLLNVRETLIAAAARQSYPFERLVRDLGLANSESRSPLFDISFALRNVHGELPELRQDISMTFESSHGGAISGRVEYRRALFRRESVELFVGHWLNVLDSALADLDRPLARLEMLGESERRRSLYEWNETGRPYSKDKCFHQLFEEHAARTPDAVALGFKDVRLTYAELNARANQLARHLRRSGVGPESLVGISLPRSAELVVALLGVLKAGGAYVPLDVEYPAERVVYMANDARVSVLLTQGGLLKEIPKSEARVICLDDAWERIALESDENPTPLNTPEHPAYVIYTSGSTGRPKGVVVRHGGLSNLADAQEAAFGLSPENRVLQFSSLNFDASIFEIVMALRNGAALYLAPQETLLPGPSLVEFLRDHAITNITVPPSALMVLPREEFPALRTIVVAGEACPAELVTRWAAGRSFFNAYGPTETTVWATAARCEDGGHKPPIGRPIANTQVYVLDAGMEPSPVGAAGELYIGGDGLARGYLNRPGLTAERFVPDSFGPVPGSRLYRTGDLVRFLPDGELEFLGRVDHQVKVRGYRVELGEIEAVISQHAAVRECVVVAREDEPGDKRLVAYVVAESGRGLDVAELRAHVRGQLPDYMVPASFVVLEELPLSPSGKVDRAALPAPEATSTESRRDYVGPRTPVEEVLCGVWGEVLGVEQVGVEEDFFELGGHSLLATQVISRVREGFKVEIALRELFKQPTVRGLAASIEAAMREGHEVNSPPVLPTGRENPLPLSFAQQRLWFVDQLMPDSPFYNIPAAIRLNGLLDIDAFKRSIEELVRRHETLRTTFSERDGLPVQIISDPSSLALRVTDLSHLPHDEREAEARRLTDAEAAESFDLRRGPLLRVKLLRLSEDEHILLLTMHHIVSDGWSMGVLVREMAAIYEAYVAGKEPALEELPIQYADFAVWQRQWLQGEVLERQLSYWREHLTGAPPVLELPTDRPRPSVQTYAGATTGFAVEAEVLEKLKALSRREGATLFMTLLAAFNVLLSRYSGQKDVVVGTNIANRNRAETEGLIGFFINNLVLRTDLSGDPDFRELLGRVREVCLGAYIHQDIPFDKLVEELQPERTLRHNPLFQVMFVLQNAPRSDLRAPGVSFSPFGATRKVSRFDLLLNVFETPQGLYGSLEYNTDLFNASTVERMLEQFRTLLGAVADDPEKEVESLSLMREEASRHLLHEFNVALE
jgi:amino acid adenylation domain-containing protein